MTASNAERRRSATNSDMTDVPGPPAGGPSDFPPPGATPNDPTTVQPVTAAGVPLAGAAGAASMEEYPLEDQPWYRKPGPLAGLVIGALALLGLGAFALFSGSGDDEAVTTDGAISMQITVTRTTGGDEPFATEQIATVTGPTDTPDGFIWVLPPNSIAPEPATAVTDGIGDVLFRWAPLEQLVDSAGWRSTLVISEVLAPNVTLGATEFNCLLERSGSTQGVPMTVDISASPVSEERLVTYSFPGHEFAPGDRMSCAVANGPLAPTTTTTTVPDPTTTVLETTTTVAETTTTTTTTVAPPATDPPATDPPATDPPATDPPATDPPATAPPTQPATVLEIIEGNPDLSMFNDAITTADLRDQLSAPGSFTIVAPNDAAMGANPSDLTDQAAAKAFVLSYVNSDEALTSADLETRDDIKFDVGPVRVIVVTGSTITIGGAEVVGAEQVADTGVVHTLGQTLVTPAP